MIYKCLIVDDERPALRLLENYIDKLPSLEVSAKCESGIEALAILQQYSIDILFLDIQMPEMTGLEMLETLSERPQVILTTAHREFALEGFQLDVTDYLLKPIKFNLFVSAVNKAVKKIKFNSSPIATAEPDHIFVKVNNKLVKVLFAEIHYVEGMRGYVSILISGKRLVAYQTLSNLEHILPKGKFMRIHKSFIVALDKIQAVEGNQVQIGDKKIPIGKSYRRTFNEQLYRM